MAQLVMAGAVPHNPLMWRTMVDPIPDDLAPVAANFTMIADAIVSHDVDVIVLIGTDHIRQFYSDNSPAFLVGKAGSYHGTFENEVRTFGMEYCEIRGHRELADEIAGREVLPEGIDFSVSNEWRLDHSFVIPLAYLTPAFDIPIVPINTNTTMPPLPRPERFIELGRHIRRTVEAWDSDARVGVITSGHMANEIGGPRQFLGGGSPDQVFDDEAVSWMVNGDIAAAVAGCTYDRVMAAGNITYQYVNVLAALAAMEGKPANFGEATVSRYSSAPFFLWSTR